MISTPVQKKDKIYLTECFNDNSIDQQSFNNNSIDQLLKKIHQEYLSKIT